MEELTLDRCECIDTPYGELFYTEKHTDNGMEGSYYEEYVVWILEALDVESSDKESLEILAETLKMKTIPMNLGPIALADLINEEANQVSLIQFMHEL